MRNRFFIIILAALATATVGITVIHDYFFKLQKIKLVDQQLTQASEMLLHSHGFLMAVKNQKQIDKAITEALTGKRIGKIFVVRDRSGKIIYQSDNISFLNAEPPQSPENADIEVGDEYLRVRNRMVPSSNGDLLQVGTVLDKNFITWQIFNAKVANYTFAIVFGLFIASVLLTLFLLTPLRLLISHLSRATSDLTNLRDVEPLPNEFGRYTAGVWARSDEFSKLIDTISRLIRRINQNHKLTRSWTLQMAHELKTPLAVITAVLERGLQAKRVDEETAKTLKTEVTQMSSTINEFLDWAELENTMLSKELHSVKIGKLLRNIATRLAEVDEGRLQLKIEDDFSVITNPFHLDQLLTNLLTNALKYSAVETKVEVVARLNTVEVRDRGGGIPDEVIERLGEPFNVGPHEQQQHKRPGTGLGLAWVTTVARLYDWKLNFKRNSDGMTITITFPESEATKRTS